MRFTGGLPETACGAGSMLKTTQNLRLHLPQMLFRFGVKRLLDAPCGDGNWISQTNLTGIEYIGVDLSRENLACAMGREPKEGFEPKSQVFSTADIAAMDLPQVDAILCRDFFQHLKTSAALAILYNIRKSGIHTLFATSFENEVNEEIGPEMFRPLNLMVEPFNLGEPEYAVYDPPGSGRILGVWRL